MTENETPTSGREHDHQEPQQSGDRLPQVVGRNKQLSDRAVVAGGEKEEEAVHAHSAPPMREPSAPLITAISDRPSPCGDCGRFIQIGAAVARDNAFEAWRHVRCPRTKFDFDPADVCPDCFTVRTTTGACAC